LTAERDGGRHLVMAIFYFAAIFETGYKQFLNPKYIRIIA
jgi:hypothetical protein